MEERNVLSRLIDLDIEVDYMREHDLKYDNPFTEEYKEKVRVYNQMCDERRELERIYYGEE